MLVVSDTRNGVFLSNRNELLTITNPHARGVTSWNHDDMCTPEVIHVIEVGGRRGGRGGDKECFGCHVT